MERIPEANSKIPGPCRLLEMKENYPWIVKERHGLYTNVEDAILDSKDSGLKNPRYQVGSERLTPDQALKAIEAAKKD